MAKSNLIQTGVNASALAEAKQYLVTHFGNRLSKLVLFGSHARGDATLESDIDLMVVLKGALSLGQEIEETSVSIAEICLKYNILIACLFMEEERFLKEKSPLMLNVHKEGIIL